MLGYWPSWLGALALGGITVGYWAATQNAIGVSGAWERVLHWREERAVEEANASFDPAALSVALRAATLEAFGEDGSVATLAPEDLDFDPGPARPASGPAPVATQAVLLVSIFVGGLLAALVSGRFHVRSDMGEAFGRIVVSGWAMWPVLFVGGVLVGLGTRLAGGCSSGHGLSGCSRLQPVSLVATGVFFGTAVVVSTLLWKVI